MNIPYKYSSQYFKNEGVNEVLTRISCAHLCAAELENNQSVYLNHSYVLWYLVSAFYRAHQESELLCTVLLWALIVLWPHWCP